MREHDACGIGFVADAQGRASRAIVADALHGLACVKHRGAAAADGLTSDGCGVLTPIPPALFGEGNGVIALFVRGADAKTLVEDACAAEGVKVLDWRKPETDDTVLGHMAAETRPEILQAIIGPPTDSPYSEEVTAYRIRRRLTAIDGLYVASCSYRTVVYKSLAAADHLADFYRDLADDQYEASFTIFHQRFSTNTLPTWERAQPFRMLCHNGEINAIQGNRNRMLARSILGTEEAGLGPESLFRPVLDDQTSDSGKLDEALELLTRAGRDVRHALAMLVPEAWEHAVDLDPEVRGFYRYHSALMEPWDGPAGLVFTDGVGVGAALDRNGLRPLRYAICEDGLVVCSSEVGAVDVSGHGKVERGRLGPGQMLFVDPTRGVQRNEDVKERLAAAGTYAHWAHDGFLTFGPGEPVMEVPDPDDIAARQAVHGYTQEELAMVLRPMGADGKEPTFSMGDDSPLPPMAGRPRPLHHYLKQRFAQVTNPPIDPLREHRVMSLRTLLGPRAPILTEHEDATRLLRLESFLLYPDAVDQLVDGQTPFAAVSPRRHLRGGRRTRRAEGGRRAPGRRGRGRHRRGHRDPGAEPRRRRPRAGPDPLAAGRGRRAPPSHRAQAPQRRQPRGPRRRRAGHPLLRLPARLRRRRRVPPPGPGDAGRLGRQQRRRHHRSRGPGQLHRRHRGRRAEDPVEDGHLHRRLVPGRPDLRGGGPGRRGRRPLPHGDPVGRRGRRLGAPRRGRPRSSTRRPRWCRPASTGSGPGASTTPTARTWSRPSTTSPWSRSPSTRPWRT